MPNLTEKERDLVGFVKYELKCLFDSYNGMASTGVTAQRLKQDVYGTLSKVLSNKTLKSVEFSVNFNGSECHLTPLNKLTKEVFELIR